MSMRKDGRFSKTFTFEGTRYYVYGATEKEAIFKMANKLRDLEERKITFSSKMKVSAWAVQAVETYKTNQKDITRKRYMQRMKHCILEQIGDMELGKVKPLHCQQVLNEQLGKSKTQINEVYQQLQFIFRKAVDNELIPVSPAAHLTKPLGYKNSRRAITEAERKALYTAMDKEPKLWIYGFMLECGCRPSEAAELKGMDIQLQDGVPVLHIRGTKTVKSDRYVPLPLHLYERFKAVPKFDYLFKTKQNNKYEEKSYRRLNKRLYREMNIAMGCKLYRNELIPPFPLQDDFTPYCLRHTFCTDLQRNGVDIRMAQYLMGHSTIQMTANIYTHVDRSGVIELARKMNCTSDDVFDHTFDHT